MKVLMNILLGFCMALADSVPGVSGGTIAFIMGFYDEFISSLYHVVKGSKEEKKRGWLFLLRLILGWIVGFAAIVLVLGNLFDSHIYELSSLFIGLSLFSLPVIIKEEKETFKGQYRNVVYTLLGMGLVVLVTYFRVAGVAVLAVDIAQMTPLLILYIVICAAIAMSAMVLPGLSGSSILLILGLYVPVITGVKELLHGKTVYIFPLLLYLVGVVLGVIVSIKFVKTALEKYRAPLMYLIVGLILGSVYSIIMGPTTLDVPQPALGMSEFRILFFVLGGVIIGGLELLKRVKERKG